MEEYELITEKNYRWIYTYDYAPDSVWEEWRSDAGCDDETPIWIAAEADACVSRLQTGLGSYILLTDSHFAYNGTWDDTVASIRAISDRTPLSGIIHLGDMTDGLLPLKETEQIEERVMSDLAGIGVPLYLAPGNHDYNYFRGNTEIRYPERPRYYVDLEDERLRLVFIDSFDPKEAVRYGFTDECTEWLDKTLDSIPDGHRAIIFSHLTPLVRLQAWTQDIRNREKLISVLDRHADDIIAFVNGHNHCDQLFNDLHNGKFPLISVNCAKCEYFTEHKPEGAEVPFRRLGDRTQESFDIIQADMDKNEIFFTRFGAGRDRAVLNHRAVWI